MNIELAFKGFMRILKAGMRGGKYLNRRWTGKYWDYEYMGQKKKSSKDNSTPSLFAESGIANKTNVNPIGQEKPVSFSQESRAAATSATQQSLFGKKKVEAPKPSKPAFSLIQDDKTSSEKKNAANASQGRLFGKKTDSEVFTKKDFKPELKLEGNETTASLVTNVKNALLKEGLDAKARDFVDKAFKEKDLDSVWKLATNYVNMDDWDVRLATRDKLSSYPKSALNKDVADRFSPFSLQEVKSDLVAKPTSGASSLQSEQSPITQAEAITPPENKVEATPDKPVNTISFDKHISSQGLTTKQIETAKTVYDTVKNLSKEELNARLERLKKLPGNNGIPGITAINYLLGNSLSEAMQGNDNAAKDNLPENDKAENNFETMPESESKEGVTSTPDTDLIKEQIQNSNLPPEKKEAVTRVADTLKTFSSVNDYLDQKQKAKDFKDVNERVSGSRKEMMAIKVLTIDNLKSMDDSMAFNLVNKNKVFENVDLNKFKDNGEDGGVVFFKKKLLEAISSKPANTKVAREKYIEISNKINDIIHESKDIQEIAEKTKTLFYKSYDNTRRYFPYKEQDFVNDKRYANLFGNYDIIVQTIQNKDKMKPWEYDKKMRSLKDNDIYTDVQYTTDYESGDRNKEDFLSGKLINISSSVLGDKFFNLLFKRTDAAVTTYQDAIMKNKCTNEESDNAYKAYLDKATPKYEEGKAKFDAMSFQEREEKYEKGYQRNSYTEQLKREASKSPEAKKIYEDRINRAVQNLLFTTPMIKDAWLKARPEFTPRDSDFSFMEGGTKKPRAEKTWEKPTMHQSEPLEHIVREGGKPISDNDLTPENLTSKWGYKSVQFGNYVKDNEAKEHIKRFVESMSDMQDALNINLPNINKAGNLSLALGARGKGKALAHYEAAHNIINLTKSKGDGTVSHEWAHFLDHLLGDPSEYMDKAGFATHGSSKTNPVIKQSIKNLFDAIEGNGEQTRKVHYTPEMKMNAEQKSFISRKESDIKKVFEEKGLEEASKYIENATFGGLRGGQYSWSKKQKDAAYIYLASLNKMPISVETKSSRSEFMSGARALDNGKEDGYWQRPLEMFARAHEAYIQDKLAEKGMKNNYLVGDNDIEQPSVKAWKGMAYPQGEERKQFKQLFDNLYDNVRNIYGSSNQTMKSTFITFLKSFLPNTKINLFGLPITIETKRGMYRTGKDANGIAWATKLDSDYGYIRRTAGADGEQIDCYIGQNPHSDLVFVMNQKFPSGRFDEHKVMLGYNSKDEAIQSYLANNPKAKILFDSMEILTLPQFKQWLMTGSKQRRMEINVVKFKSVLAEMMLMKANGYSYIKKERRGNRWKYWYKDDVTGAVTSTDEPKEDSQPKQLTFMDSIKNFFKGDVKKAKEEYQKDLQAVGKGIPETSFQAQYKEYFSNKEKIDDYLKRLAEKRGQAVKPATKNDTGKPKGTDENAQKKAAIQAAIQRMPKKIPGTNIDINIAKRLYEKYGNGAIKDNFDTMPEGEKEKPREDKSVEEYKKIMNGFSVSYLEEMKDMYSEQSKDYGYDNTKKLKAIDELIEQKTEHKPESKPVDNKENEAIAESDYSFVPEQDNYFGKYPKSMSESDKHKLFGISNKVANLDMKIQKLKRASRPKNLKKTEEIKAWQKNKNIRIKDLEEKRKPLMQEGRELKKGISEIQNSQANTPKPKLSPDERKKKVAEMSTKIKKVQEQAAEQLADKKVESESNRLEENHTQFSDSFKVKPANEIKTKEQYTTKDNYDKPVIEGIKQSILANGYDQSKPITIDSDGYVVDGHHRFTAVSELIKDGKLPKDTPIPTITKTYKNEAERLMDQVSANKMRRVVNVMDDAKAYSSLVAQGKTPQEISDRTGESIDKVKNTIALNNLIPELQHLLNSDHMSDKKRKDNSDGTKTKQESLSQGIAIAIARNGVDDDGKPNGTIQRKAFQYANQNKGATPSQVADYIKTLKSQNFNFGGGLDDKGRSREQQEALRNVGGDEGKAHANASKAESFIKDTHNALSKLFGASTGEIDPKLMKELTNSIVGARGEGKAQTLQEHIDTMVKTLVAARDMIKNELGNIKGNASMDDMFAMAKSDLWRKQALFELNKRIHMARQYDYLRR